MGAIQIKGVPEEVHRELRRRAARTGGRLSLAKAARMVRADRDRK